MASDTSASNGRMANDDDASDERWKENLLGRYPYTENELRTLLSCFNAYRNLIAAPETESIDDDASFAMSLLGQDNSDAHKRAVMCLIHSGILPPGLVKSMIDASISSAFVLTECTPPNEAIAESTRSRRSAAEEFLEGMSGCLGRRNPRAAIQILYDTCRRCGATGQREGGKESSRPDAESLIGFCYKLALGSHALQTSSSPSDNLTTEKVASLAKNHPTTLSDSLRRFASTASGQSTQSETCTNAIPMKTFADWAEEIVPHMSGMIGMFAQSLLFPSDDDRRFHVFQFPELADKKESGLFDDEGGVAVDCLPFALACLSPSLGGKWHRIYTTDSDGFAFSTLQRALVGYIGPTLLLVRPTTGGTLGYYTTAPWKESRYFHGTSDCFLFRAEPCLDVYRPRNVRMSSRSVARAGAPLSPGSVAGAHNYMYLNPSTRSAIPDNQAHGIGFGGKESGPRLHITESFERCKAATFDSTYETGPLLPDEYDLYFDVDVLEVWGVGCWTEEEIERARVEGGKRLAVADATKRKNALVDKKQFLEDFQSGTVLNSLYEHRTLARGRRSFSVDEEHGGYVLDEKVSEKKSARHNDKGRAAEGDGASS